MRCVALLFFLLSGGARAQFLARFPKEIRERATVWKGQDRVFEKETEKERQRPIWVHAGDSLSQGWANGGSLQERYAEAHEGPLPESLEEEFTELTPQPNLTWYAGRPFGLLYRLEQARKEEWVLLSTAFAGARIEPLREMDELGALLEIKHPERVELVTLSLGGNDLCEGLDSSVTLAKRLPRIKAAFPERTRFIFWKVPDAGAIYVSLTRALESLPEGPARARLGRYCRKAWERNCPPALSQAGREKMAARREKLNALYAESGEIFDLSEALEKNQSPLEILARDCFHPSRALQPAVTEALFKRWEKR